MDIRFWFGLVTSQHHSASLPLPSSSAGEMTPIHITFHKKILYYNAHLPI
jgi:hypothetical protein